MRACRSIFFISVLAFASCFHAEKENIYRRFLVGANCEVKFYCDDSADADILNNMIDRELFLLDSLLSRFSDISLVSDINKNHKSMLPEELVPLFELSDSISELTSGRFDISIAPLVELWGFYRHNYQKPDSIEIAQNKTLVDHARIRLAGDSIFIPAGMSIDLGGIAQGYVADRIAKLLRDQGIGHALINIGGEIAAVGNSPGNKPWRIGIKHPRQSGIIEIVELDDNALSTSGDYEKFFELDGRRYAHIIDPLTGHPAEDFASVTVFHEKAAFADAMATAVAIMGPESGLKFLDSLGIRGIIYYVHNDSLYRLETRTK